MLQTRGRDSDSYIAQRIKSVFSGSVTGFSVLFVSILLFASAGAAQTLTVDNDGTGFDSISSAVEASEVPVTRSIGEDSVTRDLDTSGEQDVVTFDFDYESNGYGLLFVDSDSNGDWDYQVEMSAYDGNGFPNELTLWEYTGADSNDGYVAVQEIQQSDLGDSEQTTVTFDAGITVNFEDRSIEIPVDNSQNDFETGEEFRYRAVTDSDSYSPGAEASKTSSEGVATVAHNGAETVSVESGTYNEQVTVPEGITGLTIESSVEDANLVYEPESSTGSPALKIAADGTTVEGLSVERVPADNRPKDSQASFTQGIRISGSNVEVRDTEVTGGDFDNIFNKGIMIIDDESDEAEGESVSDVDVSGGSVSGFYSGVSVTSNYGGSISDVDVFNVVIEGNRREAANVAKIDGSVEDVDYSGNTFRGHEYGFYVYGGEDPTAEDLEDSTSLTLDSNNFESNMVQLKDNSALLDVSAVSESNTFDQAAHVDGEGIYSDIQDAVEAADSGETVEVEAGTYDESVTVDKTLTIEGPNAGVSGNNTDERVQEAELVGNHEVTAKDTVLDGLKFVEEQSDNAVEVTANSVEVRNSKFVAPNVDSFEDRSGYAVWIEGGSETTVARNHFVDGNGGIQVTGGAEDVSIESNLIDTDVTGIGQSSAGDATGTSIVGNTINVGVQGVSGWNVDGMSVRSNDITVDDESYPDRSGFQTERGVDISGNNVEVFGNEISSTGAAVLVGNSAGENVTVTQNDLLAEEISIGAADYGNVLQAEHNYFGSESGPSEGQIQGEVDYRPWRMTPINQEGYDDVITFDESQSWSAFSVAGEVEEAATASDVEVLSYNPSADGNSDGWTYPGLEGMSPVDAAFVKGTKAVGVDYEDSESATRSLGEGWNFVGAFDNGEAQSLRNVFGTVESSMVSLQVPEHNSDKADERTTDLGGLKGSILSTSNLGSNQVFDSEASVMDGYWLKASGPASFGTQPSPSESPPEEG